MRKHLAIGVGIVAVLLAIVGPPFAMWGMRPHELPLRVGMTDSEVSGLLGPGCRPESSSMLEFLHPGVAEYYGQNPDWVGKQQEIIVWFDDDNRVTAWKVKPLHRMRPPLLDRALRAVGW